MRVQNVTMLDVTDSACKFDVCVGILLSIGTPSKVVRIIAPSQDDAESTVCQMTEDQSGFPAAILWSSPVSPERFSGSQDDDPTDTGIVMPVFRVFRFIIHPRGRYTDHDDAVYIRAVSLDSATQDFVKQWGSVNYDAEQTTHETLPPNQIHAHYLTCSVCGNTSGGTAWWWNASIWQVDGDNAVCPVCLEAEERESLRRQQANYNAQADGVAIPYPSEY